MPNIDRLKHEALNIHCRICLRFKPNDEKSNKLLDHLLYSLNPYKLVTEKNDMYLSWR